MAMVTVETNYNLEWMRKELYISNGKKVFITDCTREPTLQGMWELIRKLELEKEEQTV